MDGGGGHIGRCRVHVPCSLYRAFSLSLLLLPGDGWLGVKIPTHVSCFLFPLLCTDPPHFSPELLSLVCISGLFKISLHTQYDRYHDRELSGTVNFVTILPGDRTSPSPFYSYNRVAQGLFEDIFISINMFIHKCAKAWKLFFRFRWFAAARQYWRAWKLFFPSRVVQASSLGAHLFHNIFFVVHCHTTLAHFACTLVCLCVLRGCHVRADRPLIPPCC